MDSEGDQTDLTPKVGLPEEAGTPVGFFLRYEQNNPLLRLRLKDLTVTKGGCAVPRFTSHAYYRFRFRREELVRNPPSLNASMEFAKESYRLGALITREEAMDRVQGPIRRHYADYIYRADGTGPGVWIAKLCGGAEVVLTYLAPSEVKARLRRRRLFHTQRYHLVQRLKLRRRAAAL